MRIFAAILSVYILVLSGIACDDHHEGDLGPGSATMELSMDLQHSADADICNPFFFCHSGHHTFVRVEIHFPKLKVDYYLLTGFFTIDYHFSVSNPIWNSPQA